VFLVREYIPDDFEEIWILDQICFVRGIAYTRPELRHFLLASSAVTLVAESNQRIIGFILVDAHKNRGHVITIDVHPEHRRSGLGTQLMKEIERRLTKSGVTELRLEVAVDNSSAIAFYKRHGFSVVRTVPRYYNDSIDALVMRKLLKGSGSSQSQ
jgi:ribosomal-protein-alanine N-acetyltransferase